MPLPGSACSCCDRPAPVTDRAMALPIVHGAGQDLPAWEEPERPAKGTSPPLRQVPPCRGRASPGRTHRRAELAAVAELGCRRGVMDDPELERYPARELSAEFAPNEVALALTLTQCAAEWWMNLAVSMSRRLPAT